MTYCLLPHSAHSTCRRYVLTVDMFLHTVCLFVRLSAAPDPTSTAMRNPSLCLFSFPLLSHSYVFWSLICSVPLTNCPWRVFSRYLWACSSEYETLSLPGYFSFIIFSLFTVFSILYCEYCM